MDRLVKDRPECIEIGAAIRTLAFEELRGKVGQGAGGSGRSVLGLAVGLGDLVGSPTPERQAKVEHHDPTAQTRRASNQEIPGLEIAMDQPEIVEEGQCPQHLGGQPGKRRRALICDCRDEILAVDVLEGEPRQPGLGRDIEIVDLDQIRVAKSGKGGELPPQDSSCPRLASASSFMAIRAPGRSRSSTSQTRPAPPSPSCRSGR